MAKHALTRETGVSSTIPYVAELEREMLDKINKLGIGPGGLGGRPTALGVSVLTEPTHIAGLPVAMTVNCWAERKAVVRFRKGEI